MSLAREEAVKLEKAYYDDDCDLVGRLVGMVAIVCVGCDVDMVRAIAQRVLDNATPFGFHEMYALAVFIGREIRDTKPDFDDAMIYFITHSVATTYSRWKSFELGDPASLQMLTSARTGRGFPSHNSLLWFQVRTAWDQVQTQFPLVPTSLFAFESVDSVIVLSSLRMGMIRCPENDEEWDQIDKDAVEYALRRYVAFVLDM